MKITNKHRIEQFDHVQAKANKLDLVLYDLVNGRFGVGVTELMRDYEPGTQGRYVIRMSWRAMPLFLVVYKAAGQADQVDIHTDNEIQDGFREHPLSVYWRVAMHARNELVSKQLRKESAA